MPLSTLSAPMLQSAAACLFVLIWSSGFVLARAISGQIDPYLFLLVRFAAVTLVFASAMLFMRLPLPQPSQRRRLMATGALMQGLYLGPGFWAVSQGLEAGVMALIGSLQPPLTALFAWFAFKEKISRSIIIGLLLGLCGVVLAVLPTLSSTILPTNHAYSSWLAPGSLVIAAAVFSIGAITAGTLLQKSSISSVPLLTSVTFQTLGAVLVTLPMALFLADPVITITLQTLGYLAWGVFVLSIGGFTLLTWLVRTGSATRASSLLFIVPPLTALLSFQLYDESLSILQVVGFLVALTGVLLARRQ